MVTINMSGDLLRLLGENVDVPHYRGVEVEPLRERV